MARSSTPDLLFRDGADCLSMIGQIERVTLDTDWTCLAVCLMGTHYHLIVDADDHVLADAMKRINWAYAVGHNKRHGRRGHRSACKYVSIPIESDGYLLGCYRYVVRNPVEAGLRDRPEAWPWSSYAATIELSSAFSFVDATSSSACSTRITKPRSNACADSSRTHFRRTGRICPWRSGRHLVTMCPTPKAPRVSDTSASRSVRHLN